VNPITRYALIGLWIALAVSILANLGLTNSYLSARDAKTQALADRDSAREAATACSDATEALMELAAQRKSEAAAEIAAAQAQAQDANDRADEILTRKPRHPGNDCQSAAAQMDDWLTARRKKP
jgi:uncharacterized iron-regulated membrane protein